MSSPITAAEIWGETSDAHAFSKLGENRYTLDLSSLATTFEVDRLRRERGELRCELTVHCGLNGAPTFRGVLSSGDINLSSSESRKRHANNLAAQSKTDAGVWVAGLERLHILVRDAERTGDPAVFLRDVPRPSADDFLEVEGLKLSKRHPSIVFGDGGSLKSYLALFLAGRLQQAGVRAAVFDWELDAPDQRDRVERLFGAEFPNLLYVRCTKPLVYEVDRLARFKHEYALDFAIFDSIAFACSGAPEGAEEATEYFRAVRAIGVGSLHLAHVTKNQETGDQRPFGSIFWHNGARSTWFAKLADASIDNRIATVGLYPRKANLGAMPRAIAYQATFESERTHFRHVNLADVESLASRLPVWQRMSNALRGGAMTYAEIADQIGAPEDTVRKAVLNKSKGAHPLFAVVKGGDGLQRVGLAQRIA